MGHSVGELGCAYADNTFTREQAILAAYWRGRSILESQLPKGAMAAIGTYNDFSRYEYEHIREQVANSAIFYQV